MSLARTALSVGVLALLAIPSAAFGFRSGPPAGMTGGPANGGATCQQCHGSAVGSGSVEILNAPTTYQPNMIYDLVVRVADPVQAGAGFQISVEDAGGVHVGTLLLSDASNTRFSQTSQSYVSHNSTGVTNAVANWAANGNSAEFDVQWQAPASDAGPITFWASGNAINNNFTSSGDIVYVTSEMATFENVSIPTVSEWGLVVMGLLVLCAGTLAAGRVS